MTRFGFTVSALLSCAMMVPVAANAARHGPDVTLDQLEEIQNVSLQFEEHAPFTLRAEAETHFKLVGLPTQLETLKNERAAPQQNICASIRSQAATADAALNEVLSLALDFDYCADKPS